MRPPSPDSFDQLAYTMLPFRALSFTLALLLASPSNAADVRIIVLEFDLRDLTLAPTVEQERERVSRLRPLLAGELSDVHDIDVLATPPSAVDEAAKGEGYLFDRTDIAARIGREAGADYVVSGRLHKGSHLFVYLMAQVIDTRTDRIAADFVVEIKGPQAKFTAKGVETLAVQIDDALVRLSNS